MKFSLYIGTNKYSLSTEDDILKLSPDNFECQYKILIGSIDILKSVQLAYRKLLINLIKITLKKKLRVTIVRLMKA